MIQLTILRSSYRTIISADLSMNNSNVSMAQKQSTTIPFVGFLWQERGKSSGSSRTSNKPMLKNGHLTHFVLLPAFEIFLVDFRLSHSTSTS